MALVTRADRYRVLGRVTATNSSLTASTHTTMQDPTNQMSVSVTYQGNRILRVTVGCGPLAVGGAQGLLYAVLRGSTTIVGFAVDTSLATLHDNRTFTYTFNGPATGATETFKLRMAARTSNTQVQDYGDATYIRSLVVEDLGPQ